MGPIVLDDNLEPLSTDPVTISQSGGGSLQPANSVDLVSTNCIDGYPGAATFQCDVQLNSFYSRSLANVYVQVTSVTLNGSPVAGYDGTNSDATNPLGLDATHGLWGYNNASVDVNAANPVLSSKAIGFNGGTRTWMFQNTADQNVSYTFAVFASKGFSSYTFGFPNGSLPGYVDACTGGTSTTAASKTNITLPFDFTIYNTNTTRVNIARNGQITFAATNLTASGTSVALPSAAAPHPSFFAFWDNLGRTTSDPGQMCYQTIGTAPNRMFVIEWRTFDFLNAPEGPNLGSSLDFEAFLFEGTGEIDTIYNTMNGQAGSVAGRENGSQATVGLQNETGTVATAEHNIQDYGTGNSWSYLPSP